MNKVQEEMDKRHHDTIQHINNIEKKVTQSEEALTGLTPSNLKHIRKLIQNENEELVTFLQEFVN